MAYMGNKAIVKITPDGGAQTTYNTLSWNLPEEVGTIDTTAQDVTAPEDRSHMSDGLRNYNGTFVFDLTASKLRPRTTIGEPAAYELQDKYQKFTGNCIITSVGAPVEVGSKVTCTVNILVTGGNTPGAAD